MGMHLILNLLHHSGLDFVRTCSVLGTYIYVLLFFTIFFHIFFSFFLFKLIFLFFLFIYFCNFVYSFSSVRGILSIFPGYCLLPVIGLASLSILVNLKGLLGMIFSSLAIGWSTFAAVRWEMLLLLLLFCCCCFV